VDPDAPPFRVAPETQPEPPEVALADTAVETPAATD